ncbi:hypothetical protein HYN86_18205 [Flavobacterium fluviale]|uniref:Outer membrane protein beta-barrel domain-containing protein n=2 Tax=Flavobacterium fluviale TaxID=2249356 RepID=A0A344LWX6_9FLAO|nr:hypothetical protein HYN86_18205 [Flavobacterium fluviale]
MKFNKLRIAVYFILIVLSFYNANAQEMRVFGNYFHYPKSKMSGIMREIQAGIDYGDFDDEDPLVALQLSASYIISEGKTQQHYDFDNYVLQTMSTKGFAVNTALGCKIYNLFLGDLSDGRSVVNYFIMPKLNVARIVATEDFTSTDYHYPSNSFQQSRSRPAWQCYFGVEMGYEFFLSENNTNSIALTGSFSRLNFNKAFKKMPQDNMHYSSVNNFGFGVSFNFGVKKRKE